jgi:hypothetical protein
LNEPDVKQRLLAKAPQPYESGASSMAGTLRRVKGGFRRMLETELGEEQWCGSCREFWPLDAEFFNASKHSLAYECKACLTERRQANAGLLKSQHS